MNTFPFIDHVPKKNDVQGLKFKPCSNCPSCEQGRIFCYVRSDTNALLFECEECGCGWNKPSDIGRKNKGFFAGDIPGRDANLLDIRSAGMSEDDFVEVND